MSKTTRISLLLVTAMFLLSTLAFAGLIVWGVAFDQPSNQQTDISSDDISPDSLDETNSEDLYIGQLEGFDPRDEVVQLETIDFEEGQGQAASEGDKLRVHYRGALASTGDIFDSSYQRGEPFDFSIDPNPPPGEQVIVGWREGVVGMKQGGKRRIVIPAELAYGEDGVPPLIGPNQPLVFDIELIEIL